MYAKKYPGRLTRVAKVFNRSRSLDLSSRVKVSISKQTLQRLLIAVAQGKSDNKYEKLTKWNLSNHLFFGSRKKNTKKVCNNIMNSIKL